MLDNVVLRCELIVNSTGKLDEFCIRQLDKRPRTTDYLSFYCCFTVRRLQNLPTEGLEFAV